MRWSLLIAGVFLMLGGVSGLVLITRKPTQQAITQQPVSKPAQQPESPPQPTAVRGKYLFHGTIFWGRGVEWRSRIATGYNYARPFSQLDTFQRDQYDAWLADLECPVTDRTIPYQTQVDQLVFNCETEYLPEAAKYFNLINLANNHTDNREPGGFDETKVQLEKQGIQYFGHFDTSVTSDICEVVGLPVKIEQDGRSAQSGTLPVAFCGWHYFYRVPRPGEIEVMDEYASVMPVFAFAHMGAEYYTEARPEQVNIAHTLIDHGAEFVIANNPHWVQNAEAYKGKLIVYSTGNFIFDQLDSEGMRSVSIDAEIRVPYSETLARWLALGDSCKQQRDTCLTKAKEQQLTKPQLSFRYAAVAGDNSGPSFVTRNGGTELQQAIEQRLNWNVVTKQLNQ